MGRAWEWATHAASLGQGRAPRRWLGVLLVLVVGLWISVAAADRYADWLWFDQLGHADALGRRWLIESLLLLLVGGLSAAALWGNLILASRLGSRARAPVASTLDAELRAFLEQVSAGLGDGEPRAARRGGDRGSDWRPEAPEGHPRDRLTWALLVASGLVSVFFGLRATAWTESVLRWLHGTSVGVAEPMFGRDVSAYVFTMPLLRPLVGWLVVLTALLGLAVATLYLAQVFRAALRGSDRRGTLRGLGQRPRMHLAVLAAALLVMLATGQQVARADLVFSTRGRAVGVGFPGFADLQVQSPAYILMSAAGAVAAALLVVAAWRGHRRLAWWPLASYAAVVLGGLVVPLLVQLFVVLPNDDLERPYLDQTIRLTRQAYALERLHEEPPPAATALPANLLDLADVPLWSRVAIDNNLNQLQAFRPYYAFSNAQPDRYTIDGQPRLVMVGARELNPDGLPSRSWSSTHLQFTHGYGAAIALAAEATPDGAPVLVTQDLPVRGQIAIDRPEIYFGQRTTGYAVVKTTQPELDFPRADQDATTGYAGQGVALRNALGRVAFSLALRDPGLLFSQAVTGESEVLFHRQVLERVTRLAPFLQPDPEPYVVVADGRLIWVVDGYTTSPEYPGVERRQFGPDGARVNYVRDSVKATVDAYDGSVRLFVAEPDDPLIHAEAAAYPGLLESLDQMPAAVRSHLRYPRLLLGAQAEVLTRFHVQDATSFSRGEDAWRLPEDTFTARLDSGPSYALLRSVGGQLGAPSGSSDQLVLMQPFSPLDPSGAQASLVGLLLARGDGFQLGGLVLERYSRESGVAGPLEVERRIEQQPDIASQLADLQRGGAAVVRGKALPIPFGPRPLYVEALFVQRGLRPVMPQLQRVVLALDNRIVMEPTLAAALERLRSGQ